MRNIVLMIALLTGLVNTCRATPYFRFIDPAHPAISAGGFMDMDGRSDYGSMLALITHHPRDGMLVKSAPCEWTLLAIGGGYGHGTGFASIGPSANFLPPVKALALKGLSLLTDDSRYLSLKSLLAPRDGEGPDITMALGPSLYWNVIEGGNLVGPDKWRGQFRWFYGASWKF